MMPLVWKGMQAATGGRSDPLRLYEGKRASLGGESRASLIQALNRVAPRKQQDDANQDERETEP